MKESSMSKTLVALFVSTHETLSAEKFITRERVPFRPVIKPRAISSNCQMGLQFNREDLSRIMRIVEANRLALTGIYEQRESGWKKETTLNQHE